MGVGGWKKEADMQTRRVYREEVTQGEELNQ